MDFNNDTFTSDELMLQFDIEYLVVDDGLLDLLDHILHFLLDHTLYQLIEVIILRPWKLNSEVTAATISNAHVDSCFICSVTTPKALWLEYEYSVTYRLLEFQPSQNTAMRGNILLINIPSKVWISKAIDRYIPTGHSSDIDEGVFDYKCYGKTLFRRIFFSGRIQIDRI